MKAGRWRGRKIDVFGSSGFVGSEFVKQCQYSGLIGLHVDYIPRDQRQSTGKADEILYLISTTDNYNIFENPRLDIETNLLILVDVMEEWRKHSPKSVFNFVSSWFVYGNEALNVSEHSICDPKGFYSITKRTAEQLLMSYASTYDLNYRILRLSNILGANDRGVSKKKNALQYLINEMKNDRPIEIYGDGKFLRTYMDVEDCVNALLLVMREGEKNSIYNIGSDTVHPNRTSARFIDIIEYAHKKLNSKSEIRFIEPKEFHKKVQTRSFSMNTNKLKSLGFKQKHTIFQTIDRLLE